MGLWQTGYIEFHEQYGFSDEWTPGPPVILRCAQCGMEFFENEADALALHRFEKHPFMQPVLLIDGVELVGEKHTISKEISASNICYSNANECWVNGKPFQLSALPQHIAATRRGFISVRLRNELGQVETAYDLDIEIPELTDISEVDRRFFELTSVGNLNVLSINGFIQITKSFSSANTYVDGLSSYLYAILAKDQRGDIALTREKGRARMTHALQILSRFNTSLATVIVQTINFNLNAFNDGSGLQNSPQLLNAMRRFWRLTHSGGVVPALQANFKGTGAKLIPLDVCSSQLVEWSQLATEKIAEQRKEMEKILRDDAWGPEDRLKVQILLADSLSKEGDIQAASQYARRLRHDAFWGDWAEALINNDS